MNASLKLDWVIMKNLVLEHQKSIDGATAGYEHIGPKGYWNNLLYDLDILPIINDPVGKQLGLGYEEWCNLMLHDPDAYDSNGHAIHDGLKAFIKDKFFLKPNLLDYGTIKNQLIL